MRMAPWLMAVASTVHVASGSYLADSRAAVDQVNRAFDRATPGLTCRFSPASVPAFLSSAPGSLADTIQYAGTIGDQAITMVLRTSESDLSGFYFYETFRAPIQLRGRTSTRGFTLAEFGDAREPARSTGTFEGSAHPSHLTLRGMWRSPDAKRSRRFTLRRTRRPANRQVLFTWDRVSPTQSGEGWQDAIDYSPTTGELVYLEGPDVLGIFNLSTMKARTLLNFSSQVEQYPSRPGGPVPAGASSVGHVVVSHAGDRVAFNAGPRDFQDIYVMGTGDVRPRRLTDSPGDFLKDGRFFYGYLHPKFSPDDRTLLFEDLHGEDPNNRVVVVNTAGGPVQKLGEGYSEMAYWSADGTRICTYSDARTARKIVYEIPSGTAAVGGNDSYYDRERPCRIIADAASLETCAVPANNHEFESDQLYRGSGDHLSQRWVTPDVVINTYDLFENRRPGYRIQVVRFLN